MVTQVLKYMLQVKVAKTFFFFAVMFFVAKPFLGFTVFSETHRPSEENIFVKVFSKRQVEFDDDSEYSIFTIQKRLAEPVRYFFLRFSFLLCILFPVIFAAGINITNRFLRRMLLSLPQSGSVYLLNSNLII
jgi:hypothetical protein